MYSERQVSDLTANSAITHEPATPSQLTRSTSISDEVHRAVPGVAAGTEEAKDE